MAHEKTSTSSQDLGSNTVAQNESSSSPKPEAENRMSSDDLQDVKRRVLARNPRWKEDAYDSQCFCVKFDDGILVELKRARDYYKITITDESLYQQPEVYEKLEWKEKGSADYYELKSWFEDIEWKMKKREEVRTQKARKKFFD
jgi:hypothetical protein